MRVSHCFSGFLPTCAGLHFLLLHIPERPAARLLAVLKFFFSRLGDLWLLAAVIGLYTELETPLFRKWSPPRRFCRTQCRCRADFCLGGPEVGTVSVSHLVPRDSEDVDPDFCGHARRPRQRGPCPDCESVLLYDRGRAGLRFLLFVFIQVHRTAISSVVPTFAGIRLVVDYAKGTAICGPLLIAADGKHAGDSVL